MKFKKPVKILIIVVLILVALYTLFIFIGMRVFQELSSADQLKIIESVYEKCKARGGKNCEIILAMNLKEVLATHKIEAMETVKDKTKSEEERLIALDIFYELSRGENELMSEEEAAFYFLIADNDESPNRLRQTALEYFMGTKTDSLNVINLQIKAVASPGTPPELKRRVIKALGEVGVDEAIDVLIKSLEDKDSQVSIIAQEKLIEMGVKEKTPQLLTIALDETKSLLARDNAIGVIEGWASLHGIKNPQTAEALMPLLEDTHYVIRLSIASALKTLTGKEYEVEEGAEEELDEYILEKYDLIID